MRILAYKKGKTCKLLLASLVPSALFAQHAPSVSIPVQTNTQSASEQNVRGLFSPSALRDIFGGEVGNFDFARLQEEAEVVFLVSCFFFSKTGLAKQLAECFLHLACLHNLDLAPGRVKSFQVIMGNQYTRKAELFGFQDALFDTVHRTDFAR